MQQKDQDLIDRQSWIYNYRKAEICEDLTPEEIELLNDAEKIVTEKIAKKLHPMNMDPEQVRTYYAAYNYIIAKVGFHTTHYFIKALKATYE